MTNQHTRTTLLFLIIILLSILQIKTAKPKQKGLIPSTAVLFKAHSSEQILVYFDLDRDGQLDIVTKSISRNDTSMAINVYIWNSLRKQYYPSGQFPIKNYVNLETAFLSTFSVSPKLILVSYYQDESGDSKIFAQFISCVYYNCILDDPMSIPELTQEIDPIAPTLFTIDGQIMLVYHAQGKAKLLLFKPDHTYTIFNYLQKVSGGYTSDFHQSYVGDFDGDCLTDLVLLTQSEDKAQFQFLTGDIYNYYKISLLYTLNEPVHQFTILDINFDGKNDLIILLKTGQIQIHYNTNTNSTLCQPSLSIPYDFDVDSTTPKQIQRISVGRKIYESSVLLFSDYNNDGYEDLTLTFIDQLSNLPTAVLLKNIQCFDAQCGTFNPQFMKQSKTLNLRRFQIVPIPGIPSVSTRMSFIDIYDDGNMDLIVQCQFQDAAGKYIALQPVYNTNDFDAFFIKMTILARRNFQDQLSNTQQVGGSASVYVTLLSGQLAPRTANQMAQIGSKLQLPRVRFGLGRTNNYLQNLIVKLPRKVENTSVIQSTWSPIIPNSNLLVIPPPLTALQNVKNEWVLKMIIEPTDKMSLVAFLVVISLAVVGIMILHLTKKQKEEDKQNQQSFYTLLR